MGKPRREKKTFRSKSQHVLWPQGVVTGWVGVSGWGCPAIREQLYLLIELSPLSLFLSLRKYWYFLLGSAKKLLSVFPLPLLLALGEFFSNFHFQFSPDCFRAVPQAAANPAI